MNNNDFAVTGLTIRESPTLSAGGKTSLTTVVAFSVGPHGPFSLFYDGGRPNVAQITQDVTAKVNELRQLSTALAALNVGAPR